MTIRPLLFSCVLLAPLAAFAEGTEPKAPDAPDDGPAATVLDEDRYMLSETGDGALRLDRRTGRVSLCREANDVWRCVPVADAERVLEAEIERLTTENLRLSARNRELEAKILAISRSAQDAMGDTPEDDRPGDGGSSLSREDEEEIDRALDFTEKAMRRFFDLMKTLRDEFEEQTR